MHRTVFHRRRLCTFSTSNTSVIVFPLSGLCQWSTASRGVFWMIRKTFNLRAYSDARWVKEPSSRQNFSGYATLYLLNPFFRFAIGNSRPSTITVSFIFAYPTTRPLLLVGLRLALSSSTVRPKLRPLVMISSLCQSVSFLQCQWVGYTHVAVTVSSRLPYCTGILALAHFVWPVVWSRATAWIESMLQAVVADDAV